MRNKVGQRFHLYFLAFIILLITNRNAIGQETEFKRSSIRSGVGLGVNEGRDEFGFGIVYSIGWQKSFGKKNKLRLNPNMIIGGFVPLGLAGGGEQFYRLTSLGLNLHFDLIRYKAVSIVTTAGLFGNYSRGLTTQTSFTEDGNTFVNARFFHHGYIGGSASVGIRINPKNSRLAYEFRPINIQVGTEEFGMGYLMFGIDFKLKK